MLPDVLCLSRLLIACSGFDRDDTWGFRALEPNRCCITSIALVLLKTGITANNKDQPNGSLNSDNNVGDGDVDIDQQQLNTAQKLLLFWRKPARKCWWDGVDVVLPVAEGEEPPKSDVDVTVETAAVQGGGMTPNEIALLEQGRGRRTRVWARRVWTLELSLVSEPSADYKAN